MIPATKSILEKSMTTRTIIQESGAPAAATEIAPPPRPVLSLAMLADLIKLGDLLALGIAAWIAQAFSGPADQHFLAVLGAAVCVLGVYHLVVTVISGYGEQTLRLPMLKLHSALAGLGAAFLVLAALVFAADLESQYSRRWVFGWFMAASVFLVGTRFALWLAISRLRARGRLALRTVIIGAGEIGQRLARQIGNQQGNEIALLGFIDDRTTRGPTSGDVARRLGGLERLGALVRERAIDQVLITLPWNATARLRDVIQELAFWPGRICLVPDLAGIDFSRSSFTRVAGTPMMLLFDRPMSSWGSLLKRAEDLIVAVAALVFLAPAMVAVAIAIKLDSPGPIFFRQRRYGFNNDLIAIWKFRTMYQELTDKDARVLTTPNDPRVTRVGRVIRKYSLDELPQLFNVLTGEMSIVGPRPHAIQAKADGRLYAEVVPRYAARHRVKPGITGWAQVNGWRGVTDTVEKIEKRVEYDLYYVENWSLWLDVKIITRTAFGLFKDPDAY